MHASGWTYGITIAVTIPNRLRFARDTVAQYTHWLPR
jgi:hypothetical protein